MNNSQIDWIPITYTKKPPVLSTIKDVIKLIKTAKALHKKNNFDIIHCRSYISAFAGMVLKKKYGVKFVFDMRGFWADERIDGGLWSKSNPIFNLIYKYFKHQETKYFNNADYTISLTECGKNEIHSWKRLTANPIPIKVIPCCADFELFSKKNIEQTKVNKIKQELNISDTDFVLCYLGSIGTWYMLEEMLDFFKILLNKKPNAKFLFITGDKRQSILEKATKKNINTNKIIVKSAKREEVPIFLSLVSVAVFFIKPLYSKKASSPTKLAELMGMEIPVICNNNVGDIENIVKSTKCGVVINDFSDKEYEQSITEIDDLLQNNRQQVRTFAEKLFSLKQGVENYAHVYEQI